MIVDTLLNWLAQGIAFMICGGFMAVGLIGLFVISLGGLLREGKTVTRLFAVLLTLIMIAVIAADYTEFNVFALLLN